MDARRIDDLIQATDAWYGGVAAPDWFELARGEIVYAVVKGAELLELRDTVPPLLGGSCNVDVEAASTMTRLPPGVTRSVLLHEPAPARDFGVAVVTSERVVFHGKRDRAWRYSELRDIVHDTAVPESWLAVRSRKRVSGLRYPGAAALQLRFTLALAVATLREERPLLRTSLLEQRLATVAAPVAVPWSLPSQPAGRGQKSLAGGRIRRGLGVVYLGKNGVALPLRIAQGAVAALATLLLVGAVLPEPKPQAVELSAADRSEESASDAAATAKREAAAEDAAKQQAEEKAKVAAEEEAARKAAEEAARVAAEQEAARKAAEEAARVAAEQEAARLAAEEAARKAAEAEAARKAAEVAAQAEAARQAAAVAAPREAAPSGAGCMSEYPDFCIPSGPDLDCPEIQGKNFTVREPDRFRLDGNNDGVGCES